MPPSLARRSRDCRYGNARRSPFPVLAFTSYCPTGAVRGSSVTDGPAGCSQSSLVVAEPRRRRHRSPEPASWHSTASSKQRRALAYSQDVKSAGSPRRCRSVAAAFRGTPGGDGRGAEVVVRASRLKFEVTITTPGSSLVLIGHQSRRAVALEPGGGCHQGGGSATLFRRRYAGVAVRD